MEFQLPADPRAHLRQEGARIAALGNWPAWVDIEQRLVARLPQMPGEDEGQIGASGFDAGIACAFGLIPEEHQQLAAQLHANYTPEAVARVRTELEDLSSNSSTCWWLAASSLCEEGNVHAAAFLAQYVRMADYYKDSELRLRAAKAEWAKLQTAFHLVDGVPFTTVDGGMQAAYVAGHEMAVMWTPRYGIFFIGTFHPSLGLEDFEWSDRLDGKGRPMSGAISPQFVKCSGFEELGQAVAIARQHLGI